MAETLELEVATPERELVREQVSEVQLPGKNGYLGVLPGHAPLLGLLGIGTLTYVVGGNKRSLSDPRRLSGDSGRSRSGAGRHRGARRGNRYRARRKRLCSVRRSSAINPALGVDPAEALAAVMRAEARLDDGPEEVSRTGRGPCSPDSTSDTPY